MIRLIVIIAALNVIMLSCLIAVDAINLKIIGLDKRAVSNAEIRIKGYNEIILTNENGEAQISLLGQDKLEITIMHPNYMEKRKVLTVSNVKGEEVIQLEPLIKQSEEVVVTATRYPEKITEVPAIETVLNSIELEERGSNNIESSVQTVLGVSSIGSGGFSKVPSIRGMARRRILLLVDNARINSDRRTGPSASFIMPDDIDKIEVMRNPGSVFYGSDAIGGVIHIITKKPDLENNFSGKARFRYGFNNQEKEAGVSLNLARGNYGAYLSLQGADAENYKTSDGEVPYSYFSNYGFFTKLIYSNEAREIELSLLINKGVDIGKPSINSLEQPTWYPKETHNLVNFLWKEKITTNDGVNFRFYLDPNKLETHKDTIDVFKTKESLAINKSTDYGLQIGYSKVINERFRLNSGVDMNGRYKVNAENIDKKYNEAGEVIKTSSYSSIVDGKRSDYGIYMALDYTKDNLDINMGIRYDYIKISSGDTGYITEREYNGDAVTGFVGVSYELAKDVILIGNVARAYRMPELSERFYVGITGRGYVIGNPNLKAERSNNLDFGLRILKKSFYMGLYSFYYKIDDMVERYKLGSTVYTYGNIEKGVIKGFEYELEYYPYQGLKIFANGMNYYGKSEATGMYLNDVPPYRIICGGRIYKGDYWVELNAVYQHKHSRVGPAEIEIPSYTIMNLIAGININDNWKANIQIYNIFNKLYIGRPDPEGVYEPGRSVSVGISYEFR
jgi:outer membrane receptor protein involved in Fe transport